MRINYESIYEEAKDKKISPAIIVKQVIKYKESKDGLIDCCNFCKELVVSPYTKRKDLCMVIGVSADENYIVNNNFICSCYKKR